MIKQDLHIHSEYSYDATLPLDTILAEAEKEGITTVGITDHVNYNNKKFLSDLYASANAVNEKKKSAKGLILGVELTPIPKPEFDYIARQGDGEGFIFPESDTPYPIELAVTKEELRALGVQYAIGAAHWRVDVAPPLRDDGGLMTVIKEWYRQQMYLAADERITILGHPWWKHGAGGWYDDFTLIPRSMNTDIIAALKENGKYIEANLAMFNPQRRSEKFIRQYAEFLREAFEAGVPVTYGSDAHKVYPKKEYAESALAAAGFVDGDIGVIIE